MLVSTAPAVPIPMGRAITPHFDIEILPGQLALTRIDELTQLKSGPAPWLEHCLSDSGFELIIGHCNNNICCFLATVHDGNTIVVDSYAKPRHRHHLAELHTHQSAATNRKESPMTQPPSPSAVAPNYHPLPVELASGEGLWVSDSSGEKYLDALAGYSALNFGHRHPRLVEAARRQLDKLTLTSRAFNNDQLEPFCRELAQLCSKNMVLPMNTGAEAVESAIKVARRWGYQNKNIPTDQATVIVMGGNFHGRTTTIVSFSDDASCQQQFGPFTPGFRQVPFADAEAIKKAIDDTTVAVLLEPIQGEAGVIIPPADFLPKVRQICDHHQILFIADEIQSGLCRTGATFACDLSGVTPDLYLLGKALGGGILPVSAVVGNDDILGVLTPGSHGSTFGGNPLAMAVGREVVAMVAEGTWQQLAQQRGEVLASELQALVGHGVVDFRSVGLWAGIDVDPQLMTGRQAIEGLLKRKVLAKDTHGATIRFAPALVITDDEIRFLANQLKQVLAGAG